MTLKELRQKRQRDTVRRVWVPNHGGIGGHWMAVDRPRKAGKAGAAARWGKKPAPEVQP